ncbi:MAG: cytochrome c family protein [candidate division KSB1 bacterium]|nr:cytochrome c family protein [candidate division KSB1 bacterium]
MRNYPRQIGGSAALFLVLTSVALSQGPGGEAAYGTRKYADFERPETCRQCHVDFYYQWQQAMMSQAYVHHWDEIEYFRLAVPHAERDPQVAGVKAGCNGCHSPLAFLAGDTPPPPPSAGSRANEAVSCEVCHLAVGRTEDTSFNYNYVLDPGRVKYGNREGVESPHHMTKYSPFLRTAAFCGTCHNEKSPYGVWVKSTQLEWEQGPYAQEGVPCHVCHMPRAPGRNAITAKEEHPDVAQHLFHGAHDPGKVRGSIEVRMQPNEREVEPGDRVVITVQLFNGKCGHKVPSGSAEERQLWLHVEAVDANGRVYHLPVDRKGFPGEEHTITSNELAYQDIGEILGDPSFRGLPRDALPEGDRIFCLPYFDPKGRRTIAQWNTASLGVDYRIGPRETKVETYTWTVPEDIPIGRVTVRAELNYRRLVKSVADFLGVPEDETEIIRVNEATTWFDVVD